MRYNEHEWLDRTMSKRDKTTIVIIIIAAYILLNVFIPGFRKFNMHAINYVTYYTEFGVHVLTDTIKGEKTEFEFRPLNIGPIDLGVDDKIRKIKSGMVVDYNADAIGNRLSQSISGYTMNEAMNLISNGY